MPIVAVGAALFAGAEIASVGLAAMSTFEAIAAVGAVTAGVGVVTGNENLTKIGGIAALAGGVGMFASNQGWLGAADSASGSVATSTAEMSGSNPSAVTANPGANIPTGLLGANPSSGLNPAFDTLGNSTSLTNPLTSTIGNGAPLAMPDAVTGLGGATNATGAIIGQGTAAEGAALMNATKPFSFMDKLSGLNTWAKDNPLLAYAGLQTVGGMFDPKNKLLQEQADREAQDRENRSKIPSLDGYTVGRTPKLNASSTPAQVQAGLINYINTTPTRSPTLTGLINYQRG